MEIMSLLSRFFRHEEINGANRCPTYLHRWTLFQPKRPRALWRGFGIYLHQFVGDDWSRDLHDHPKRFISIGLKGGYIEWTPMKVTQCNVFTDVDGVEIARSDETPLLLDSQQARTYRAPWFRTFPAEHVHRLSLLADRRPCWTLVIVLWHVREWGFWHRGVFHHWRGYVRADNAIANERKACP
jgi:hypothetical protein